MEAFTKEILVLYGPLAIGWLVAAALGWRLWFDTSKVIATQKTHESLIMSYHQVVVENVKVMERLAVLIEERTRLQALRRDQ